MKLVTRHTDLEVYRRGFVAAMHPFELSKSFPRDETYSLTDQVRRSSRSVCSNLAEAGRKRRYEAAFICKLNDSKGEAAETQTWLQFSVKCGYVERSVAAELYGEYDEIIAMLVDMSRNSSQWCAVGKKRSAGVREQEKASARVREQGCAGVDGI